MQLDSAEDKIDLAGRIMHVDVITITDRLDRLGQLVQLMMFLNSRLPKLPNHLEVLYIQFPWCLLKIVASNPLKHYQ